jgi:hypothetical protein
VGIQLGEVPSLALWDNFVDCSITRNDLKPIAQIVANLQDTKLLCLAFDRLGRLLIGTPGYTHEEAWAAGLNRMLSSPLLSEQQKDYYFDLASPNRRLVARLSRNPRATGAR